MDKSEQGILWVLIICSISALLILYCLIADQMENLTELVVVLFVLGSTLSGWITVGITSVELENRRRLKIGRSERGLWWIIIICSILVLLILYRLFADRIENLTELVVVLFALGITLSGGILVGRISAELEKKAIEK